MTLTELIENHAYIGLGILLGLIIASIIFAFIGQHLYDRKMKDETNPWGENPTHKKQKKN